MTTSSSATRICFATSACAPSWAPPLTASTVTVSRSTSKWWRSIGSVAIVNTTGAGSASPLISITTRRMSMRPRSRSSSSSRSTCMRSSRFAQHAQPPPITRDAILAGAQQAVIQADDPELVHDHGGVGIAGQRAAQERRLAGAEEPADDDDRDAHAISSSRSQERGVEGIERPVGEILGGAPHLGEPAHDRDAALAIGHHRGDPGGVVAVVEAVRGQDRREDLLALRACARALLPAHGNVRPVLLAHKAVTEEAHRQAGVPRGAVAAIP